MKFSRVKFLLLKKDIITVSKSSVFHRNFTADQSVSFASVKFTFSRVIFVALRNILGQSTVDFFMVIC